MNPMRAHDLCVGVRVCLCPSACPQMLCVTVLNYGHQSRGLTALWMRGSSSILSFSLCFEVSSRSLREQIGHGSWSWSEKWLRGTGWTLLGLFMSPWGRVGEGLQAAAAPLPTQPACPVPGGQGVLAQLLFACTNARLFASLPTPSLLVFLS